LLGSELRENLADLYALTGAFERSLSIYEALLSAGADVLSSGRLRRKRGNVFFQKTKLKEAADELWAAARLLGGHRPSHPLALALATIAAIVRHLRQRFLPRTIAAPGDDAPRVAELCRTYIRLSYVNFYAAPAYLPLTTVRASNLAETLGESLDLCHSYSAVSVLYAVLGFFESAQRYGARALSVAERLGSLWHQAQAHSFRGLTALYMNRLQAAEPDLRLATKLFRACGDIFELAVSYFLLADSLRLRGELHAALACCGEAIEVLERLRVPDQARALNSVAAACEAMLGRADEATIEKSRRAVAMTVGTNDPQQIAVATLRLGETLFFCGKIDAAIEAFEEARQIRETNGLIEDYTSPSYGWLARALVARDAVGPSGNEQGRRTAARLVKRALRLSEKHRNFRSPALLAAGVYRWATGDRAGGRRSLEGAIAVARAQNMRFFLAEASFELGTRLREHGDAADAEPYLAEAERLFAEMGSRLHTRDG
jgi:tetratricopeptide (TPR) repeat protein